MRDLTFVSLTRACATPALAALTFLLGHIAASAREPVHDVPYEELTPKYFDVHYSQTNLGEAPVIAPWKTVVLDPDYRGSWIVTGDLTGDGNREIVTARSVGGGSARYTSAVAAHDLDGNVLWKWGDHSIGSGLTGFDVACQIHDCNGDGKQEVVLAADRALVILNGQTGQEIQRIATPPNIADSIMFCDLQGVGQLADVIVKDRYEQVLAYSPEGRQLWRSRLPGGYPTAHQPQAIDFDDDGKDELIVGFAALNGDGSMRWVLDDAVPFSAGSDLSHGHLDCARVLVNSKRPEDLRLAITFCGGNRVAVIDGNGKFLWRVAGAHFESADIGKVIPEEPGRQIVVDIDHQPRGKNPLVIFNEQGELLGRFILEGSRHHLLTDWNGDGVDSIVVASSACMYNGRGETTGVFDMPTPEGERTVDRRDLLCQTADMDGDGSDEILLSDNPGTRVYVYKNEAGGGKSRDRSKGSDNFSYY